MNEASSKYVDQIATEKLLSEKLRHVHHLTPHDAWQVALSTDHCGTGIAHFDRSVQAGVITETPASGYRLIQFTSSIATPYPSNNQVAVHHFPVAQPAGNVIFVHGLYEDNLGIYSYFISLLNQQGLDVYLLMLPYHYERKPAESLFSGEYFWSGNVERSVQAYCQAVNDLYQLYRFLQQKTGLQTWLVGFSLGGGIVLSLAAQEAVDGVFAINPVCNIAELVWSSALFAPVCEDLVASGISLRELQIIYQALDPLNAKNIQTPVEQVILAASEYDQINQPRNYDLLIHQWSLSRVIRYKAGHLNILRVPRLAIDVAKCHQGSTTTRVQDDGSMEDDDWRLSR